ncbi:MAG TPA: hypothetical protein VFZ48_05860 [Candidatus Saccharimonadales bacterium]
MAKTAVKLRQQQALFIGAFSMLLPELEKSGFIDALEEEAGDKENYLHDERSRTALLQFCVLRGKFSALAITFNDPSLVPLFVSVHKTVKFGESFWGVALTDEQCDAVFEAFLDECRRFFQRHKLWLPDDSRRFFTL